jgi:hypothetical protein
MSAENFAYIPLLPNIAMWGVKLGLYSSPTKPNLINISINFAYIPAQPDLLNVEIKLYLYSHQTKPWKCRCKTLSIFPPNQTLCKNLLAQTADHKDIKYLTTFREEKFQYNLKDFLRYVKEAISQDFI